MMVTKKRENFLASIVGGMNRAFLLTLQTYYYKISATNTEERRRPAKNYRLLYDGLDGDSRRVCLPNFWLLISVSYSFNRGVLKICLDSLEQLIFLWKIPRRINE